MVVGGNSFITHDLSPGDIVFMDKLLDDFRKFKACHPILWKLGHI